MKVIQLVLAGALAGTLSIATPSPPAKADGRSIYRLLPAVDYPLIAIGMMGAALPDLCATRIVHRRCAPCDPQDVNALDRSVIGNESRFARIASDVTVSLVAAAPIVIGAFDVGVNSAFREDMTIYAEVLALNSAFVNLAKYTVQRPRPWTYAPHDPATEADPDSFLSFYSGHTSFTFAALSAASMTYTYRHGVSPWPWVVTGLVGTMVGLERVAAGRHFYSDVATGALIGTGTGILVPWLHHRDEQSTTHSSTRVSAGTRRGSPFVLWSFRW